MSSSGDRSARWIAALLLLPMTCLSLADPSPPGAYELAARMEEVALASWPSISADGTRVAYVSTAGGVPQVRVAEPGRNFDRQLTAFDDPVTGVQWSPGGGLLAVSVAPNGGMNSQIYLVNADGGEPLRITRGGTDNNHLGVWSPDGRHYAYSSNVDDPAALEPYLYELETRRTRRLAAGRGMAFVTDVSPDRRSLVLERVASRGNNNLFILDAESGTETLLTEHAGAATFGFATLSGDRRSVFATTNAATDRAGLGRIDLRGARSSGALKPVLSRSDAELELLVLNRHRDTALLAWNSHGRSEIWLVRLTDLSVREVSAMPGDVIHGADFSPDGRKVAIAASSATTPSAIWLLDVETLRFSQIGTAGSPPAGLPPLVAPRLERYRGHDGLELSGWLYVPRNGHSPWPTVVAFHGGPEGQARPEFVPLYQVLVSRGIAVFDPNVRGSAGFGQRFMDLDNGPLRFDAIRDIESTATHLIDSGIADRRRLGIAGASYGGFMAMAGLTEYPELFAAGADIFGLVNFETFFAHTEPWIAAISTVEYGDPLTQGKLLRRLSPINHIERVTAPVIVLHGGTDTNVPVREAEQVVAALRQRNVPVEYVFFPDEGHGFRKKQNRVRATAAIAAWFERYLTPAAPP